MENTKIVEMEILKWKMEKEKRKTSETFWQQQNEKKYLKENG